jgi:hypothetical protein
VERGYHAATFLEDGRLLVTGGCNATTCIPWSDTFPPTGPPSGGDAGPASDGPPNPGYMPPPYVDQDCTCRAAGRRGRGGPGTLLGAALLAGAALALAFVRSRG